MRGAIRACAAAMLSQVDFSTTALGLVDIVSPPLSCRLRSPLPASIRTRWPSVALQLHEGEQGANWHLVLLPIVSKHFAEFQL
jgi:hypothetical protein